jgi:Fe-S-cluster containining protein
MDYINISKKIDDELNESSKKFIRSQKSSNAPCPEGCAKCCINPDISCSPFELLPLALHLIECAEAEIWLTKAYENRNNNCLFLTITDLNESKGFCSKYNFRPLVCRGFGFSSRVNKHNDFELNICKILRDNFLIIDLDRNEKEEISILSAQKRLEAIDPVLMDAKIKMNVAFIYIMEKVLLWNSYSNGESSIQR